MDQIQEQWYLKKKWRKYRVSNIRRNSNCSNFYTEGFWMLFDVQILRSTHIQNSEELKES